MKMGAQIGGTSQAIRNANDGISLIQTAEGALGSTHDMVGRVQMLSVQAANGTLSASQRSMIQTEINQLTSEINRVSSSTNFNGINLLDGSLSGNRGLTLQIGANNASEQRFNISINSMSAGAIGLGGVSVLTQQSAMNSIDSSRAAIQFVSEQRADLGAMQNRFEHTVNSLVNSEYNMLAAQSRIADTDMARAMIDYTTGNIVRQSSLAMLAHAIKGAEAGIMGLINPQASSFRA
jgi:flagellin